MTDPPATFTDYLATLKSPRRDPFLRLYQGIKQHIDPGFEHLISYGMPGWVVPFSVYPAGYHPTPQLPVPFISIVNQKGHIAVYHMGLYADPEAKDWFTAAYADSGYRLNMGASCIRFTNMKKIPYEVIDALAGRISMPQFVERYRADDPRN